MPGPRSKETSGIRIRIKNFSSIINMDTRNVSVGESKRPDNRLYAGKIVTVAFGDPLYVMSSHRSYGTEIKFTALIPGEEEPRKHMMYIPGTHDEVKAPLAPDVLHSTPDNDTDVEKFKKSILDQFENGTSLALSPIREITNWTDYYSSDELKKMGYKDGRFTKKQPSSQ